MSAIKEFDEYIFIKEDTHQYFRKHDMIEYLSVSKFKEKFKIPFDSARVSRNMTSSKEEQMELLAEWNATNKISTDHGTAIHLECENINKFGKVKDPKFKKLESELMPMLKMYKRNLSERICYNDQYRIAGTADWPAFRNTVGNYLILDINDYKTNLTKGILNFSGKVDPKTKIFEKYYNTYFLHPIEYIEASNYNEAALQLSIYAYFFELMWDKVKIGGLNIIYIDEELNARKFPVPYLRIEVIAMLERYGSLLDVNGNRILKQDETGLQYSERTTLSLLSDNSNGDTPNAADYE
jgi:hypothetical protein